MAATKRNALLKELSGKLKDQIAQQSGRPFGTLPDTAGVIRSEVLRKRRILYERSMKFTDVIVPGSEQ